jgi:hypothetical protein
VSALGLSPSAAWVLRSLLEHPELRTVDAIVAGPAAPGRGDDSQQAADGLAELHERGLAVKEPVSGWRATEAAHAA